MTAQKRDDVVRLDLTAAQRELVKSTTGRDAEVLELTAQELEQRIAPKIATNHNETLLSE